jgi:hypothetical protein
MKIEYLRNSNYLIKGPGVLFSSCLREAVLQPTRCQNIGFSAAESRPVQLPQDNGLPNSGFPGCSLFQWFSYLYHILKKDRLLQGSNITKSSFDQRQSESLILL